MSELLVFFMNFLDIPTTGLYENLRKYIKLLWNFNLFEQHGKSDVKSQQYGTRIYIVLLIVGIVCFLLYSLINIQTATVTVVQPSLAQYSKLVSTFTDENNMNLYCPCSTISISYEQISTVTVLKLHEICDNEIVNPASFSFYQYPYEMQFQFRSPLVDNRRYGASFYANLKSLCLLSNQTVQSRINRFLRTQMISSNLLHRSRFALEFNQISSGFRRQASADILRTLQLITSIWHGNQYISGYFTNWRFEIRSDYRSSSNPIPTLPVIINDNCSCATSMNCFTQAFFRNTSMNGIFFIPGMKIGCKYTSIFSRNGHP